MVIRDLKKNDIIKSINGKKVQSITEVSMLINTSSSEKINIKVLRNQNEKVFTAQPNIVDAKDAFGNNIKKK